VAHLGHPARQAEGHLDATASSTAASLLAIPLPRLCRTPAAWPGWHRPDECVAIVAHLGHPARDKRRAAGTVVYPISMQSRSVEAPSSAALSAGQTGRRGGRWALVVCGSEAEPRAFHSSLWGMMSASTRSVRRRPQAHSPRQVS
jgi:hypothetical protein